MTMLNNTCSDMMTSSLLFKQLPVLSFNALYRSNAHAQIFAAFNKEWETTTNWIWDRVSWGAGWCNHKVFHIHTAYLSFDFDEDRQLWKSINRRPNGAVFGRISIGRMFPILWCQESSGAICFRRLPVAWNGPVKCHIQSLIIATSDSESGIRSSRALRISSPSSKLTRKITTSQRQTYRLNKYPSGRPKVLAMAAL